MTILAAEAAPIAAEALGGGEAAAAGSGVAGESGATASKLASREPRPKPPASRGGGGSSRPPQARKTGGSGTSKRQGGKGGKKGKGSLPGFSVPGLGKGDGSTAHKVVVAEFILCVVLIGLTPILMRKPDNGHLYVPNDFVRLSAVCLLFFVLALLANGGKTSRFASAFGGLVTLGVVFNATGSLKVLGSIFVNSGTGKGQVQTASASKDTIQVPTYTPTDPTSNPLGTATDNATGVQQA